MYVTRRRFLNVAASAGGISVGSWLGRPTVGVARATASRATSAEGLLDVELTAREEWVRLGTDSARLLAFNGQVPGPRLELVAGDEVRIRLINQLAAPTNLHFHGLHVPPGGTADNIFLEVPPGEVQTYAFRVPPTHPAGLFWLHPHVHGTAAEQVSLGLVAPLIIRGELDAIPDVAAAREHLLILQDFTLDRLGRPVDPGMSALMAGREGPTVTTSGATRPRYAIEAGGLLRLRILNASVSRFYRLSLEAHPMHIIATDGGSLASPDTVDQFLLAPGERRDVLIQGTRTAGAYRLLNLPYDRGSVGMMGGSVGPRTPFEIATVEYDGRAERALTIPDTLVDVERLPLTVVGRTFTLSETMGMMPGRGMGMRFRINGREFDRTRIDERVTLGAIEDWEYVNTTTMDHPMHLHTNPFQLVARDGLAERAWRDGVIVPARGRARIRVRFDDFVGTAVQHCHILDHEDLGMMATVAIDG